MTFSRILAASFLFLITLALLIHGSRTGADFEVFYRSGLRFLENQNLYQLSDGWSPYKYHPLWAPFFSLSSLWPFSVAAFFFNALNLFFWGWAARIWMKSLGFSWKVQNLAVLLLLCLNPLSAEVSYGQVNGFLFWGSTQIFQWTLKENDSPLRAGILMTLLISLKLNFALLLVPMIVRCRRTVWGIFAGLFLLHLGTLIFFSAESSLQLYRSWIDLLLTQSADQYNTFEVQGVLRLAYILLNPQWGSRLWLSLLLLFLAVGLALEERKEKIALKSKLESWTISASFWLSLIFVFSPLAWWYQVLFLYPMIFTLGKMRPLMLEKLILSICVFSLSAVTFNTVGRDYLMIFKFHLGYLIVATLVLILFFSRLVKISRGESLASSPLSSVRDNGQGLFSFPGTGIEMLSEQNYLKESDEQLALASFSDLDPFMGPSSSESGGRRAYY